MANLPNCLYLGGGARAQKPPLCTLLDIIENVRQTPPPILVHIGAIYVTCHVRIRIFHAFIIRFEWLGGSCIKNYYHFHLARNRGFSTGAPPTYTPLWVCLRKGKTEYPLIPPNFGSLAENHYADV